MKKYLFLLLFPFIACKSSNKQPVKDSTTTQIQLGASIDIDKVKSIIRGVWVKISYVDKVAQTKSPVASADKAYGMTTMFINPDSLKGDSIRVPVGWGNHEGSDVELKFKPGKRNSTVLFGPGELGYFTSNRDTVLTTYWPDEHNKIIATAYRRALITEGSELGYGLDYMINKILVAGNYSLTDSLGKVTEVTFGEHGKLSGLRNFKKYNINIDLNIGPMDNLDEIGFNYDTKDRISYSFKIDADTLKLYETKPNSDSMLSVLDKLKYKLVRVR